MRKVRDQPSTTQEELANDLKAFGTTVTKRTISNTLHREGLKSFCVCKVPLLKKAHVQARLKFAKEHLDDPEVALEKVMWSDENKIELCLEEEKMLSTTPRTPSPLWSMEVETLCFGGVSQLRWQDDFTISRAGWMGSCTGKFWATTSFPQWEHWQWVVNGSSNMTMTQNIRPRQQRSGSKRSILRSWSGLASLQTYIPSKICGGSWSFELPSDSLGTFRNWRESAKKSGPKSLPRAVQTVGMFWEVLV